MVIEVRLCVCTSIQTNLRVAVEKYQSIWWSSFAGRGRYYVGQVETETRSVQVAVES